MKFIGIFLMLTVFTACITCTNTGYSQDEKQDKKQEKQEKKQDEKQQKKKQDSENTTVPQNQTLKQQEKQQEKQQDTKKYGKPNPRDFRVLSCGNAYIEVEYTPAYTSETEFLNSGKNSNDYGKPDLSFRVFPVFLPSLEGNRIDIIDAKFEDIQDIDIQPVPTPKKSDNRMEVIYEKIRDEKAYSQNVFYPGTQAVFRSTGQLRNKYIGAAQIYPVLYNPALRTVRRLISIKFRISFGASPVYGQKPLSKDEIEFFTGLAINSEFAMDWSTKEFNSFRQKSFQNSVLASGDFFRLEVKEDGIFKLDKAYLDQAGINTSGIDPRTIKIYGNGGMELPFNNAITVPTDLVENKIYIEGEADGRFDEGDYILFCGRSPNSWRYDTATHKYIHKLNSYSTVNYYYINYGGANGLRMTVSPSSNIPDLIALTSFQDKFFEEPEVNNLGSTGNLWLSQRISVNDSYAFNRDLQGYVDGTNVTARYRIGNGSFSDYAQYLIKDNNSGFSVIRNLAFVTGLFAHIQLELYEDSYTLNPGRNSISFNMSLPSMYNNPGVSGYYDYVEFFYKRSFSSAVNNLLRFNGPDTTGIVEYQVSPFNTSDIKIFDVTSGDMITPISASGGIVRFQSNNSHGNPKEFFVIGGNNYKTPSSISPRVQNQNIHGITDGAGFIILTPSEFRSAADRLKALREAPGAGNPEYLKTYVFDINQVYNEFSGGVLDPLAVRNFLKYAFFNWNTRPVYVLFMGDGSYDYKNIYNLSIKNFMPPFEKTTDDVNEISSYNSDDFMCEINESHPEPTGTDFRVDFATGRICVNSLADAQIVINKIESYSFPQNYGIWKKKIMYVADDGWTTTYNQGEEGAIHTQQCEEIAEYYTPKDFEKEKIYIVTYPAVITPQGRRKPGANVDIINGWNEGRLVINYTGHGSTDLWAHEHIFVRDESIPQLTNKGRYPFVTIASCDLARWDDPFLTSAAEQLVFVQDAGAIGVVAATRPVFANYNAIFNNALWSNFMFAKDTLNLPIRVGKAMFNVKNQLQVITDNDLKFCLIGDPTVRVSIPEFFTRIDSINNTPGSDTAVIKALQKVKISGSVLKPDSTLWSDFNGDLTLKVLDVDKNIVFIDFNQPFYFRLDGGTIFKGNTSVQNGKWIIEFIVPKDISYMNGTGRMLAYFRNNNSEGSGFTDRFRLNGIDTTAVSDSIGPQISLFLGTRDFRSGDVVNQNTRIIADFFDLSGMNLTGAIGHRIEATVNNNNNSKIDLTGFYNSTNGYQYGTAEYPMDNLSDGSYTLKLSAWDTYNNTSSTEVTFTVKNTSALSVSNVYNYPNPMKDNTSFTFQHNFDASLSADIKIYTVAGRLIKNIRRTNISDKFVVMDWDGKDDDGDYIANGTYIYKLIIKSEDGSFSNVTTGKLAKLK